MYAPDGQKEKGTAAELAAAVPLDAVLVLEV